MYCISKKARNSSQRLKVATIPNGSLSLSISIAVLLATTVQMMKQFKKVTVALRRDPRNFRLFQLLYR